MPHLVSDCFKNVGCGIRLVDLCGVPRENQGSDLKWVCMTYDSGGLEQ